MSIEAVPPVIGHSLIVIGAVGFLLGVVLIAWKASADRALAAPVHVLMEDLGMTMRSAPEPIGVAVRSEDEAKAFVAAGSNRAYKTVCVHGLWRDAYCDAFFCSCEDPDLVRGLRFDYCKSCHKIEPRPDTIEETHREDRGSEGRCNK